MPAYLTFGASTSTCRVRAADQHLLGRLGAQAAVGKRLGLDRDRRRTAAPSTRCRCCGFRRCATCPADAWPCLRRPGRSAAGRPSRFPSRRCRDSRRSVCRSSIGRTALRPGPVIVITSFGSCTSTSVCEASGVKVHCTPRSSGVLLRGTSFSVSVSLALASSRLIFQASGSRRSPGRGRMRPRRRWLPDP